MSRLEDRIAKVFKEETLYFEQKFDEGLTLIQNGLDSLDGFNLLIAIEEEFEAELKNRHLPDDLVSNLNLTLKQVVSKITEHLKTLT